MRTLEALAPQVLLLPTEPYRFNRRHQADLQKRFPAAAVHLLDGQALTWYLSRTEEGLELIRSLESMRRSLPFQALLMHQGSFRKSGSSLEPRSGAPGQGHRQLR